LRSGKKAVYETHSQAEEAVKELQRSGFDMKKMSIVGKDKNIGAKRLSS
jgi:hypothetical protein